MLLSSLQRLKASDVWVLIGALTASKPHEISLLFGGRSDPESQWKEQVSAGVYAAHGFALTWLDVSSGGSTRVHLLRRPLRPLSRSQLRDAIRTAAARARVRLDRIELLKPMGYAPVITITVRDPAAFRSRGGLDLWPLLARRQIEGFFLVCRGSSGRVYARGGTALRTGGGAGVIPGSVPVHG